jgi:hypothetical protein
MADIINKLKEIEDLFQRVTTQILGINPETNGDRVRISWPSIGAPSWKREEDVVFIGVSSSSGDIIQQTDVSYKAINNYDSKRTSSYTRIISVRWIFYGPNSFDNADKVQDALVGTSYAEEIKKHNLYVILDTVAPVRAPEPFNGQYWDRTDLDVSFNEAITREGITPYIQSVNVIAYNEKGEI